MQDESQIDVRDLASNFAEKLGTHTRTHCDSRGNGNDYILSRVFSANCEGVSRLGTPGCDDTNAVLRLQKFKLEHAGCV